jgi:hypothetical protein
MQESTPTTPRFNDAKTLLKGAYRYESKDSAFGDSEVSWFAQQLVDGDEQTPIADGYFSRNGDDVSVTFPDGEEVDFTGREAFELYKCGNGLGEVGENSSMPRTHKPI